MNDSQIDTAITRLLEKLNLLGANIGYLALDPKPLIAVEITGDDTDSVMEEVEVLASMIAMMVFDVPQRVQQRPDSYHTLVRSVSIDRLPVILATGCDVEPSDSVIHAAPPGYKASEYGGSSKVTLLLDGWKVEKCVQHISPDIETERLEELKRQYPYERTSEAGDLELWRIPTNEYLNPYYSMWIPGDPWDALIAVFVIGSRVSLLATTMDAIRECESVEWTPNQRTNGNEARVVARRLGELIPCRSV